MSGLLAGKVWQSALAPHLKPLAAALADIGNDDGTSIYPSVSYVAWLLGRSERSVQYGLDELRNLGVLVIEKNGRGGRHSTTEYRMAEEKFPTRQPWREVRKGATVSPFTAENGATIAPIRGQKGAIHDTKGCNLRHERVKLVAPEPSLTVSEPKKETTTTAPKPGATAELPDWLPLETWNAFLEMRKKLRKEMGTTAVKLAIKKLEDLRAAGNDPKLVLEQSILNSWQGLFELRVPFETRGAAADVRRRSESQVGAYDPSKQKAATQEEIAELDRQLAEHEREEKLWKGLENGTLTVSDETVAWVNQKAEQIRKVKLAPLDPRPRWFKAFFERAMPVQVSA